MTNLIDTPHSRRDFLKGGGALIVAFGTPLTLGTARAKAASGAIGPALVDPNLIDSPTPRRTSPRSAPGC